MDICFVVRNICWSFEIISTVRKNSHKLLLISSSGWKTEVQNCLKWSWNKVFDVTKFLCKVTAAIITACQWSCRKVMFSQLFVCLWGVGEYLWSHVLFKGWISPVPGPFWRMSMYRGGYVQGMGTHPLPHWTWELRTRVGTHSPWTSDTTEIRSANGRYVSCWNAVLLTMCLRANSPNIKCLFTPRESSSESEKDQRTREK